MGALPPRGLFPCGSFHDLSSGVNEELPRRYVSRGLNAIRFFFLFLSWLNLIGLVGGVPPLKFIRMKLVPACSGLLTRGLQLPLLSLLDAKFAIIQSDSCKFCKVYKLVFSFSFFGWVITIIGLLC